MTSMIMAKPGVASQVTDDGSRTRRYALPAVPFADPYRSGAFFYVRECYDAYYTLVKRLLTKKTTWCVTLTGTPGIGKSVFYAYFSTRYLSEHPNTWIVAIAYEEGSIRNLAIVGERDDIQHFSGDTVAMQDVLRALKERAQTAKKKMVFLCDGTPQRMRSVDQMVVVTSPNERWLKLVEKLDCTYYMPLWALEELQDAARVLCLPVTQDEIAQRFYTFGGTARYCLHPDQRVVCVATNKLMRGVPQFVDSTVVRELLTSQERGAIRYKIVHYEPQFGGVWRSTKLASEAVKKKLADQLLFWSERERRNLRRLLRGVAEGGSLRAWLFEAETHTALTQRRSLHLRPLVGVTAPAAARAPITLNIERAEDPTSSTSLMVTGGPYHGDFYPRNHEMSIMALDGESTILQSHLLLFQPTVSLSSFVDAASVIHALHSSGALETVALDPTRAALVFVVPREYVKWFKHQKTKHVAVHGTGSDLGDDSGSTICHVGKATETEHSGTYNIRSVHDLAAWGRANTENTQHELVVATTTNADYSEMVATIPQFVCTWEATAAEGDA